MAQIKSYTDIEQSKKLAEILPLESADMTLLTDLGGEHLIGIPYIKKHEDLEQLRKRFGEIESQEFPCWSLASLLVEIPEVLDFEDDESDYALEILKESGLYYLSYGNPLENGKIEIEPQENFVDACYEMIIKLHELNLL